MRGEGIIPVMEVGNNNNGGFGGFGNNQDWAWIIILFLIFGFNGNRGGFGGGSGSGAADNYVLASDFATLQRQLSDGFNAVNRKNDAIQEGICDATFSLNNTINNGFFGVQNALCQGFSGINQSITTNGYETRNAISNLGYNLQNCCCDIKTQLADCCCKIERGQDQINFNTQAGFNAVTNAICMNTRDIIDNQNANYRALHEELVANKLEMKNDRIAELTAQVNKLQLAASQERQSNYLISQLGDKCPVPAYVVQPSTSVTFPTNCCGQFTGYNNCGCGNY